jgi:mannose-1-phosphate guanylyltransferase
MKAFLLAAGAGSRLRPLTESVPKCLVPIRGTPLLALWLRLLEKHGITSVVLTLHHLHERVIEYLESHRTSLAVDVVYESRLLGSAGTVLANRGFVDGERRFLVLYADVLTNVDLQKLIQFHDSRRVPLTLGVVPTDRPREKGTVAVDGDNRVIEFTEKSEHPRSNLANAGIYVATQELFDYLPACVPANGAIDFGHHVLPRMVPNLAAYPIEEFLIDIGTPENYLQGQALWPGLVASPVLAKTANSGSR